MADHPRKTKTMQQRAQRDWVVICILTLVGVLALLLVSLVLRRSVRGELADLSVADTLPFVAEDVVAARRQFADRALQFEALRGAPVYLVDPAR